MEETLTPNTPQKIIVEPKNHLFEKDLVCMLIFQHLVPTKTGTGMEGKNISVALQPEESIG